MLNTRIYLKKIGLAGAIAGLALFGFFIAAARAGSIEPPAVIEAVKTDSKNIKPIIKGATDSGTLVNIYIDGVYNGKTVILSGETEMASFAYEPFLNLDQGEHIVWAISEDEEGNKSAPSNIYNFTVQADVPAPVLYTPVVNNNTTYDYPLIVGLARNDLKVGIYIDKELNGEIEATKSDTEAATFTFKPKEALARGGHMVYAVAQNSEGRTSRWSNAVYFKVAIPQITAGAEEENSEAGGAFAGENNAFQGLENGPNKTVSEEVRANEDAGKKMPLNLIVFIIFLAGVVGWVIWVNKELIKEKNEQSKDDITSKPEQKTLKK